MCACRGGYAAAKSPASPGKKVDVSYREMTDEDIGRLFEMKHDVVNLQKLMAKRGEKQTRGLLPGFSCPLNPDIKENQRQ